MISPDLKKLRRFGALFLFGAGVGASAADLQTLVSHSPFAAAAGPAAAKAEAPENLEFRGLVVDEDGTAYSLFDATAGRSYWVKEGGKGVIRFKAFDAEECVLEVEQNGRALTLPLKSASIATAAIPPPASPARVGRTIRIRTVTAEGAQAPRDARIANIAEQVRQRRAARQAAAGGRPEVPAAPNPGF